MRSIDSGDARITSILVADDPELPRQGGMDVVVRLRDGRGFLVNLLPVEQLQQRLAASPTFLATRLVVVQGLSDDVIVQAVRAAVEQGIERFGVLQPPLEQ